MPWERGEFIAAGLVLLAVMLFTTPWDNLAARWGIWGFPPGKYLFRIGYLPVEEYAFFLLQSLNVMLGVRALWRFQPAWQTGGESPLGRDELLCLVLSVPVWIIVGWQLHWVRRRLGPHINYTLHLAWFLPVLYFQWMLAPFLFLDHAATLVVVTAAFGLYYTLADLVAVRGGTWHFDEKQITGIKLFGLLPWEEAAFFFLTSLLVAQSFILLLPAGSR